MSELNKLKKQADKVYAKMENMQRLSDSELKAKTDEFKMRLANGETLEQILPDAYAAVGEAAYRTIGLRPYKVQPYLRLHIPERAFFRHELQLYVPRMKGKL